MMQFLVRSKLCTFSLIYHLLTEQCHTSMTSSVRYTDNQDTPTLRAYQSTPHSHRTIDGAASSSQSIDGATPTSTSISRPRKLILTDESDTSDSSSSSNDWSCRNMTVILVTVVDQMTSTDHVGSLYLILYHYWRFYNNSIINVFLRAYNSCW